jgi:hypothetical protein
LDVHRQNIVFDLFEREFKKLVATARGWGC